ncbi:SMI1/KNR4 family protein [Rheinheimera tangshanensis]|uniref:SMI1/KNR4 family protein n=1 Tax=Rheinheimera tangshanensis TaxID=400153 RepID=A0A5C8LVQ7_9GAMM|nr:SMI1/KNR4 family protein [Rheinheimera tangshanensis]TXK79230.1 SMI1/KNR4 family protein [Rheinheimera tangshanensis]GGM68356.1 hypothetical protein GCM10010920_31640 [Rheinheimera tangshanensis]
MNKEFYQRNILKPLEIWKARGESVHDKGAILLGFMPEVAPKAYAHIIFPPLNESFISEFQQRLNGRRIPESLAELLKLANGMSIFLGEITLNGYIPLKGEKSKGFLDNPPNIMIDNGQLMVKGSDSTDITIGWYQTDGSYINIKSDSSIVRFKPGLPMQVIQSWPDLETWLSSEIARLNTEWQHKLINS